MLVREVLAVLVEAELLSEKVTLVGLGVPLDDEKGFGKNLVVCSFWSNVLNDLSDNGWKADGRDANSERSWLCAFWFLE